jgi:hypothetical protein
MILICWKIKIREKIYSLLRVVWLQRQDNETSSASSDKLFIPRDCEEPPADYVFLS